MVVLVLVADAREVVFPEHEARTRATAAADARRHGRPFVNKEDDSTVDGRGNLGIHWET